MLTYQAQHAVNQSVSAQVGKLAKSLAIIQVGVAVGVTTGAGEGTLARNLNGEHWHSATQNASPRGEQFADSQARTRLGHWILIGCYNFREDEENS